MALNIYCSRITVEASEYPDYVFSLIMTNFQYFTEENFPSWTNLHFSRYENIPSFQRWLEAGARQKINAVSMQCE